MFWLGTNFELSTDTTLTAVLIFSVLSLICSTVTIIMYLKIKTLRTLIYRFFFHVAINEWISRISYLVLFLIKQKYNLYAFRISSTFIYFSDTNIIILVTFVCFGMYQLILKQNNKLAQNFNKISIYLYSASAVITVIFFCISMKTDDNTGIDKNLYRNVICLTFIIDLDQVALPSFIFTQIIYLSLLVLSFIFIFLIQGFVKDRAVIDKNPGETEASLDKSIISSLKLKTFKIKLLTYPLLNFSYIVPLSIYLWIEFAHLHQNDSLRKSMSYLRVRYIFYNIYCFLNSIRGWIFFKALITNEKIKIFILKKFFYFDLFKTIEQIEQEEELSNPKSSTFIEGKNIHPILSERETDFTFDSSFDAIFKKKKGSTFKMKIKSEKKETKKENNKEKKEGELLEMNSKKALAQAGLINDEEEENSDNDDDNENEDDDEEKKLKEIKSEN